MSSKQISRITTYTAGQPIRANEHNAEHQQYIDNFNELFQSFDYDNNFHYPLASFVKFNFSSLKLEDFMQVAHNPDGTLKSHTHSPSDISPQGSGSGLDADTVDGQHASDFASAVHNHNLSNLADVDDTNKADGKILQWDSASGKHVYADKTATGASTFLGLSDTPGSYAGQAGKIPVVKSTEDGLEFTDNTSSDEKVKADSSDITTGYLSDKVDNSTIEVDTTNHVLKVKDGVFASASHNHNLSDLADVDDTDKADGRVLKWDATAGKHVYIDLSSGGSSTFTGLTDTPSDYTGQGGNVVIVKTTEDGLEFTAGGSGSGIDADLVRGLPADFTSSKATSGYQKLPSGLIIQWGTTGLDTPAYSSTSQTITFPIAFPNACLVVVSQTRQLYAGAVDWIYFTAESWNTTSVTFSRTAARVWIAIGY